MGRGGSLQKPIRWFFMRESFTFNRLHNASVLAAERQHFSARAAQPQSGAVVRDFKNHVNPMAEG